MERLLTQSSLRSSVFRKALKLPHPQSPASPPLSGWERRIAGVCRCHAGLHPRSAMRSAHDKNLIVWMQWSRLRSRKNEYTLFQLALARGWRGYQVRASSAPPREGI